MFLDKIQEYVDQSGINRGMQYVLSGFALHLASLFASYSAIPASFMKYSG